jgi:hypothetical protein
MGNLQKIGEGNLPQKSKKLEFPPIPLNFSF